MTYSLHEISSAVKGRITGKDRQVTAFLTDSRALQFPAATLFIALQTSRNDGHRYVRALAEKNVKCFLVSDESALEGIEDVSAIVVPDTLSALQQLAAFHRERFSIPVIGITGSNGKTIVKEWLYQLLKDEHRICRSPKSYNSQVGVPLSILNLDHTHTLAIFEAGISQPGEMERLEKMIRPSIGVLTGIGSAHDEGFSGREQKLEEKMKLFSRTASVISHAASPAIHGQNKELIFIDSDPGADVSYSLKNSRLIVETGNGRIETEFNFTDQASSANAATCIAVMLKMGYDARTIADRLPRLEQVALRLELKNGIYNSVIINDFYNSDLDSLKIALSFLVGQRLRERKVVVISDIEQSGLEARELYAQLSHLLLAKGIDQVIAVGTGFPAHQELFPTGSLFFRSTGDFMLELPKLRQALSDSVILLKGARSYGFEKISNKLQLKSHDTAFEINLNKLSANVNHYRTMLAPGTKMMCMVKAMGYGSGSTEVAMTLQNMGIDYLAVAYADEGVELRSAGITIPIMVMSPEMDALDDILACNLEPEIYSMRIAKAFAEKVLTTGQALSWPVHIKIDTGMHRLGFDSSQLEELLQFLADTPALRVTSVFSHLAASDNPELDDFTEMQLAAFEDACKKISAISGQRFMRHICNSGGISRFPRAHFEMVRLGIGMYGIGVNEKETARLANVGTLKTRISQLRVVPEGESIGYNRNGILNKDAVIAVLPIGYADGFMRKLGNGRHGVYVNDRFCRTVGNVCMDMTMVDVSDVTCKEGDEVIIFSNAAQVNALASALDTISYEVLTAVSARVKRIYVQE